MTDTHCHINFEDKFPDVAGALARAQQNNVDRVIAVGCDTKTSTYAVELADKHEQVFACVGWHPNYAADYSPLELKIIEELAGHPKTVAIGEVGLDYHWNYAAVEQQRKCTSEHLELAIRLDMPVVFHCREAYDDLLAWLEEVQERPREMVLHCFGGSSQHAARGLALGCHFGVDGPVTYTKADDLRAVLSGIPLDRLLLETDAPYLTPHPYRGKPNEPAMIPLINAALAAVLGLSPAETAAATDANAARVFGWQV